eukprot:CAMPEP_0183322612 /NCGR_PEP_ID=MMETSP0160_2-20130417/72163_1 /TAXON_ID=2839 ORGANISM="Odontella Sinensis, Strain Grunow 1884" /NCGR_SAMPLE_ID=MMETSP0160_2 /ASSEMBLY_ACC=CAM_ASM_000250 /LENGTH=32 /DNA_ID= /DNA_START= /DNA_END= /DNA_ORIENTATION=
MTGILSASDTINVTEAMLALNMSKSGFIFWAQ